MAEGLSFLSAKHFPEGDRGVGDSQREDANLEVSQ